MSGAGEPQGSTATTSPTARRGEKVALALGAGGARGFAQIGVIEALDARGIEIITIAGASSGALVGGVYAAGKLPEFRDQLVRMRRGHFLRLLDPVFGEAGLFSGTRLVDSMREVVGDPDIESMSLHFTAVAVDLQRQRLVWLRRGPLWTALRASFSIPGLFTPHEVHGRLLVDGGLLAPLPIAATRMSDAQRLIAVDMHGLPRRPPGEPAKVDADPDHDSLRRRLGAWVDRKLGHHHDIHGDGSDPLSLVETMSRSLDIMQAQISRVQLALDPPELVISIPRDACQFYEFWRAAELVEIGRAQAEKALDAAGY